nr:15042_t:CDS:2 [Entrophospora candida]
MEDDFEVARALSVFVEGPDHTANVPTVKNPEDVIIEVGPTNKIVYISGVLNETPLQQTVSQ